MWRNYLTVGLRALAKNRTYAFINIFGLSLGIAACLLILGFVRYEFGYDRWMKDADRTFELQTDYLPGSELSEMQRSQTTAWLAGEAFRKDFAQAEKVVWASSQNVVLVNNGVPDTTAMNTLLTDGDLFAVLGVPFVRGDPATALSDPHALVLSETEATKRFGDADPIGKTITVISGDLTADYRVTGVFQDIRNNSFLRAGAVARIQPLSFYEKSGSGLVTSWRSQNGQIYIRLKPGVDPKTIEAQFPAWEKRNIPNDGGDGPLTNPGQDVDFKLVNVRDIHLLPSSGPAKTTDRGAVLTFAVIALLILAMACMNFTNLATARASQRAREVALRKVLGATRGQLIVQFVGESLLITAFATLIALSMAELTLPWLNAFLNVQIVMSYLGTGGILLPVVGLAIVVGLVGGVYPAVFLSRFEPARILKANKSAASAEGSGRLRNLLVVVQFAVSIGLIICTAVIYAQTLHARNIDAGYSKDHLLQVRGADRPQFEAVATTLLDQIRRVPGVTDASRVGLGIATGNNSTTTVRKPGETEGPGLGFYAIDTHTLDTLGMRLIAGRNFSETIATDDATTPPGKNLDAERALLARGVNVILSSSAVTKMGFASPAAAIGKQVQVGFVSDELGMVTATVVGVVADVNYRSVRHPVQPILYYYQTAGFNVMLVRFNGDPAAAKDRVEQVWKRMIPDIPFAGAFVDDIVNDQYNDDEKRAQLFGVFAILAVVIGCLGLFGLAAFTAEQRTKEIGIRKVLGARTGDIVRLLVWQFSRPVAIANIVAWPIAWWVMRDWLNGFDDRIALGPVPFLGAATVALIIAVGTVAGHAIRIARANPIHALRYE